MTSSTDPQLFQPIQVGDVKLQHRIVMAPLTRFRADANHVPSPWAAEYYTQRASVPGTLIVSEGTFIAEKAGGFDHVPGIWNHEQIEAWKKITDAVHAKGSYIFCQLWALGRGANPKVLERLGLQYVSASDVPTPGSTIRPRSLTVEEIHEYTELYAQAARNAVRAGFDGIEVHGANGYLVDQFLQDITNSRTDEYGGSIENRSRFGLEVLGAISKAIGEKKTAIRLSPWEIVHGMGMKDPKPTFAYFVKTIKERFPDFAYIHTTEARVFADGRQEREPPLPGQSNDFLRDVWAPKPLIVAGGFTRDLAVEAAAYDNVLVAFGRYFISNPDLPLRLKKNIPLSKYNRATFYTQGSEGYLDYPFSEETKALL
ncbi:NADH:flavin oxidoreductase/NADH oxidase [Neolentinus lepideus HHB14362 ss-1]|uniref:NADH:flavin oxidoreductase/NADH oxidase n=1 Tax=Neolentinus lepideus HHB14362 ss-1 TaxID=1314782 RepID=A0A165Q5H5_9AGAM|nr:NADH:flavin oxidoreductase/NADH oxidase [Neolentinus lepideus HHB14362 ss-1]